ncbi:MAG: hypothetical protein JWO08_3574 [Verrucomicrobiaceae bacterium]|nr:hypothetical protein [Verrucomicrobiaceae bacterium]
MHVRFCNTHRASANHAVVDSASPLYLGSFDPRQLTENHAVVQDHSVPFLLLLLLLIVIFPLSGSRAKTGR